MINNSNDIEEKALLLPNNSKLVFYTGGLIEARGKGRDMKGLNRLDKKLLEFGQTLTAN